MLRFLSPVIPVLLAAATMPAFAAEPVGDAVSADAAKRDAALKAIQTSFGEHLRPYLTENSADSSDKLRALLEDQISVTHWARDVIKLDDKKRAPLTEWGLKPENFPLIASAYSNSNTKQAAGLKTLGKVDGEGASFIIARFIPERNASTYTAAMDAAWDRKPTDDIVSALWTAATRPPTITVNGRTRVSATSPQQAMAVDTLIHLKAPQLGAKIDAFLEKPTNALSPAELDRLILAAPTPASVAHYAKRLENKSLDVRMKTLHDLIEATGQKEADYKLDAINEEKVAVAIEQFNKWLAENKSAKFPGLAAPAATRPAERNPPSTTIAP